MSTYKEKDKVFINMVRNMYKDEEYKETLKRIFSGQELTFVHKGEEP